MRCAAARGAAPYWGLSAADLVIEGVSEGYDPAMVAVFAKADGLGKIGPVGAARDLGLQFTLPLNAVPVHIGKNGYASNLLNLLAYQDVDGLHTGTAAFQFDADRYAGGYREENCWYTNSEIARRCTKPTRPGPICPCSTLRSGKAARDLQRHRNLDRFPRSTH